MVKIAHSDLRPQHVFLDRFPSDKRRHFEPCQNIGIRVPNTFTEGAKDLLTDRKSFIHAGLSDVGGLTRRAVWEYCWDSTGSLEV
jgi:hypothetical protein